MFCSLLELLKFRAGHELGPYVVQPSNFDNFKKNTIEKFSDQEKYQEPDFQIPGLVYDPLLPVSDIPGDSTFGIAYMLFIFITMPKYFTPN